ncbi:MAG: hypothetical protein V6Z86_10045 [Hyphomicrobiales bacterium]
MLNINPGRVRPQNRVATPSDKQPTAQTRRYAAPTAGLMTNISPVTPLERTAVVMENFWPTASGSKAAWPLKESVSGPKPINLRWTITAGRPTTPVSTPS